MSDTTEGQDKAAYWQSKSARQRERIQALEQANRELRTDKAMLVREKRAARDRALEEAAAICDGEEKQGRTGWECRDDILALRSTPADTRGEDVTARRERVAKALYIQWNGEPFRPWESATYSFRGHFLRMAAAAIAELTEPEAVKPGQYRCEGCDRVVWGGDHVCPVKPAPDTRGEDVAARERVARAIFVADCPPNMIPKDWDSPMILGAGNAHRNRVYAMADAAIAALTERGSEPAADGTDWSCMKKEAEA